MREPIHPQPQIEALRADVDALDQKLDDAGLLRREHLAPERVEVQQGLPNLLLAQAIHLRLRHPPGADHDLRRAQQSAYLVDDRGLDLRRRQPSDRAGIPPLMPLRREAANLSRMRSPITSRSNWGEKESSTLRVSLPIDVVVLKAWVTETKVT